MIAFKPSDETVTDMINYAVAKGCPVTDFNTGAIMRTWFEVTAWVISGYSAEIRVDWETALKDFIYDVFTEFIRKDGTKASTTLIFSANDPVPSDVTIPAGTIVKTDEDFMFETTVDGTILSGQTQSAAVAASSVEIGKDKNVAADKIVNMVSNLLYVTEVTNNTIADGGTDAETDNELQARFSVFVSNLAKSTLQGYVTGAKSVEGVKYAYVVEDLGVYAETEVRFSATVVPSADILIPAGTRVKTAANIWFITTEDAIISAGNNDSNDADARAINRGIDGNVAISTVTVIVDTVSGVDTVTNIVAATGGTDGNLGRVTLYVDDGSGSVSQAIMDEVIKTIEGDALDRANYPGYRAAGVVISYETPTIVAINITQIIYVTDDTDRDDAKTAVETKQTEYINSLLMGQTVVAESLTAAALTVQGVKDINITTPPGNTAILKTQIGKSGVYTTQVVGYGG